MQDQHAENGFDEIVGESSQLKQVLRLLIKVAQSDAPVLILGEAGSGKELIARAIHRISARRNESFLKVNCEAAGRMPESDLFGQERGTEGESRKIGHLELANPGIVFLDEIADVPITLQAKLLRLLERREFERLGGTYSIRTNVRLIATTKYDLGERVAEQMFLGDLYDKLNVFPIQVPPLRERRDDIPLLAQYFQQKFARRMNKPVESISAETTSWLTNSDWPGNVRQLENLIERSVALTDGVALQVSPAGLRS
ncbi:MAG TPA: sigma 54-interacting transcriptional regulator [Terriglobales bacterium]|jgi:formate hydrogenlyase transcriptional activator|nr:sigma 54-interacting transcriptional regulator [Terriglobales bacterium]